MLPSRAQRSLYGATLASYLLGEQIASALLAAAKLTPRLILTDYADLGVLGQKIRVPLVLVRSADQQSGVSEDGKPLVDNLSASTNRSAAEWGTHPYWGNPFNVQSYMLQLPVGVESEHD